jgi:organic radical activating enzyme
MDKIKRFIECLVPVTACNMRCEYCYIIQENRRSNQMPNFKYSPEHIGKALSQERLGGTCYISICGSGETLLPIEVVQITRAILEQGHYVNITTNGTINDRFNDIISFPSDLLERLHFAFSLHYLELVRLNKLEDFFSNITKIKEAGCSFVVQANLYDEYLEHIEKINKICLENIGSVPQLAATRDEKASKIKLLTKLSSKEYIKLGSENNSPLFDFTMKNFMVKRREFCYAGDWSAKLHLDTGLMKKCYDSKSTQYIFDDIQKDIDFKAVGNNCKSPYCVNSSHFMSLGVIPEINTSSYAELRDRPEAMWYSEKMKDFLGGKLAENNVQYSKTKKIVVNVEELLNWHINNSVNSVKRRLKKILFRE